MADLDEDLIVRARVACANAIDSLNACVTKMVNAIGKEAGYDKDAVVHLAWLTHQIIVIMGAIKELDGQRAPTRKRDASSLFR